MIKMKLAVATAAALVMSPAHAATLSDAAGDFIASYTGPRNADLDVIGSEVFLKGDTFNFTATLGGTIGTTAGGFYVFGVNRGSGTARFGAIATNVLFDSVVVINNDGTGIARDLLTNTTTTLAPGNIVFNGSSLNAFVSAAALPGAGFAPAAFTYNLWPRSPGAGTGTISDFAPDNTNAAITAVPEPATWAMMIGGFAAVGAAARRRKQVYAVA